MMELQERINVLFQGAELAQKAGALTIDEAYVTKKAMDALKNGIAYKEAFSILIQIAEKGQKAGVYTLKDAHLLYAAAEGYERVIPIEQPAPQPAPVSQEGPTGPTGGPGDPGVKTAKVKKTKESN